MATGDDSVGKSETLWEDPRYRSLQTERRVVALKKSWEGEKGESYTPDFYHPELGTYVEIKGWMAPGVILKLKKVVKKHKISVKLLRKEELKVMGVL